MFKLNSENKDLSWVLIKNPESGVAEKKIRQGTGYGWFQNPDNPTSYVCYFKDGIDQCSFSEEGFEYLDQSQYSSMLVNWALINTLLSSASRNDNEKDVVSKQSITFYNVSKFNTRAMEHFVGWGIYDVEVVEVENDIFDITVSGDSTIKDLLNFCMVMCIFVSGRMRNVDKDFYEKYTKIMREFDLPYFLRYLFVRNYISDKSSYDKYIGLIEKENMVLNAGDTSMQRLRSIEKQLTFLNAILDIGCGEGFYAMNFTRDPDVEYHAMDTDEEMVDIVQRKANARGKNITTYNNLEDVDKNKIFDILLVEVIEHMSLEDAKKLLKYVVKYFKFQRIFVTTPNKAFNPHYLIKDDEFRHDDHKWEMDFKDFKSLIVEIFGGLNVCIDFQGIGDSVDGEHTTSCAVIKNNDIPKQAIVTIGPPGCGKSTYAQRFIKNGWTEINRDNVRFKNKERDYYNYRGNEHKVTLTWNKELEDAIEIGNNIIISDTNLNLERLGNLKEKLSQAGYVVTEKHFQVDFEELLRRNNQRLGGVSYENLLNFYKRQQNQYNELFVPYEVDESLPWIYIFDIDGTLAERGDRSPFDMSKVDLDTPIRHVVEIFHQLWFSGKQIFFFSGRSEDGREKTIQWMNKKLEVDEKLARECLFMRQLGDNRKDYIVKAEMFNENVRGKFNVACVFDDRKQVIEQCWNILGVPVVNVGNNLERF